MLPDMEKRGKQAKGRGGATVKGKKMISVYCLGPTKEVLVRAVNADCNRSVTSLLLIEALSNIAEREKKPLEELIPRAEYEALALRKFRTGSKKKA